VSLSGEVEDRVDAVRGKDEVDEVKRADVALSKQQQ